MQIEIKIDPAYTTPSVVVYTDSVTPEIVELLAQLSAKPACLTGFCDSEAKILQPDHILSIYAANQKVFAQTDEGTFQLKARLYELEQQLCGQQFVRISHSEIINLRMVEKFDLSLSGTICVKLKNKKTSYASRRYVAKIKQILGI